jgi:hypothetical protein
MRRKNPRRTKASGVRFSTEDYDTKNDLILYF